MRIPLANHHLTQIHTYVHACTHACVEMTTSSHPLNVLTSIFCGGGGGGGGGGGDIDRRVGTAASVLVVESGFMNDHENIGHENMCDDRSQNDLQTIHVHAKAKNNRAKAEK